MHLPFGSTRRSAARKLRSRTAPIATATVPSNLLHTVGDKLGFVTRRMEGDLERFKQFIEARGQETGARRGEIPQHKVGQ